MKKGENGFPHSYSLNLIIDNHHLQCVSYLHKPSRLVKSVFKWCKNSLFKVENFKIEGWGWGKKDFLERGGDDVDAQYIPLQKP